MVTVAVRKYAGGNVHRISDVLAVEAPLQIYLAYDRGGSLVETPLSITMRTPGYDQLLVAGLLFTEGLIENAAQIADIREDPTQQRVTAVLQGVAPNSTRTARQFYASSSCGVCGKTELSGLAARPPTFTLGYNGPNIDSTVLAALPARLRAAQKVFDTTGGLHASGLFDIHGKLLALYEDIGRHNALDKLIGSQLLAQRLPLANDLVMLSGRMSFELVQKVAMVGGRVLIAVGAPSSAALDLAQQYDITLIGFMRSDSFNCYHGSRRIQ